MISLIILTYIFIALAAITNAGMDKTETEISYNTSIFSKWNPLYWSKVAGSENAKLKGTKYPWNAWHNFKTGMVTFLGLAMICFGLEFYLNPNSLFDLIHPQRFRIFLFIAFHLAFVATVWIQTFNLFYNHIFKLKK